LVIEVFFNLLFLFVVVRLGERRFVAVVVLLQVLGRAYIQRVRCEGHLLLEFLGIRTLLLQSEC